MTVRSLASTPVSAVVVKDAPVAPLWSISAARMGLAVAAPVYRRMKVSGLPALVVQVNVYEPGSLDATRHQIPPAVSLLSVQAVTSAVHPAGGVCPVDPDPVCTAQTSRSPSWTPAGTGMSADVPAVV